jgi:predicted 2-oxoglutarate/Fe(II)-dependent dioxygenase YbiX
MHIESKIGDQGLYIVDCVDKEYLDELCEIQNSLQKIDQLHFYRTSFPATTEKRLVKHLRQRLREALTYYLDMANLNTLDFLMPPSYKCSIWKLDKTLHPHRDTINYDDEYTGDPRATVNALLYVTDEYEGGNINFPEYGISIKPKAGSVLVFDSGVLHGVDAVTSGERLTVQSNLYSIHTEGIDTDKDRPWIHL